MSSSCFVKIYKKSWSRIVSLSSFSSQWILTTMKSMMNKENLLLCTEYRETQSIDNSILNLFFKHQAKASVNCCIALTWSSCQARENNISVFLHIHGRYKICDWKKKQVLKKLHRPHKIKTYWKIDLAVIFLKHACYVHVHWTYWVCVSG